MLFGRHKTAMIDQGDALPGRTDRPYAVGSTHAVLGTPIEGPYPAGLEVAYFGLGCFWGAEKAFWQLPGVYSTAAGYMGGYTPHPTYEEVCSAHTGHTEAVQVVYDPTQTTYDALLKAFWEGHDPSQENRQGNDIGTQYRSALYWTTEKQREQALASKDAFQPNLSAAGYGEIKTELSPAGTFYFAEAYHQQYLHKVPNGYCPSHSTGASCPIGVARA